MLGERIRHRRQQLGLSQQQLAGKEMTRAFVSLVESGRCNPSPETLRIIAARLGTPADYLLDGASDPDQEQLLALVMETGRALSAQPSGQCLEEISARLSSVASRAAAQGWTDLEARSRRMLARCLHRQGEDLAAWEEGDRAVRCLTALKDTQELSATYREIGDLAYRKDDYPRAVRAYENAVLYSAGLKSMQQFHIECLLFLGSALFRMGKYPAATDCYREALHEASCTGTTGLWADAAMSYGSVLYRVGQLDDACDWTRRSIDAFRRVKSPSVVLACHNLGVLEMDRGNWETAYSLLQDCLQAYKEQGWTRKQASVLEDLARYWSHQGVFAKAEEACWEAVGLLDLDENTVLRGRLYRMLGTLAARRGDVRQAGTLLHVSMELLRRLKAETELASTRAEIEKLKDTTSRHLLHLRELDSRRTLP